MGELESGSKQNGQSVEVREKLTKWGAWKRALRGWTRLQIRQRLGRADLIRTCPGSGICHGDNRKALEDVGRGHDMVILVVENDCSGDYVGNVVKSLQREPQTWVWRTGAK